MAAEATAMSSPITVKIAASSAVASLKCEATPRQACIVMSATSSAIVTT
jgi:hypothetical protein